MKPSKSSLLLLDSQNALLLLEIKGVYFIMYLKINIFLLWIILRLGILNTKVYCDGEICSGYLSATYIVYCVCECVRVLCV